VATVPAGSASRHVALRPRGISCKITRNSTVVLNLSPRLDRMGRPTRTFDKSKKLLLSVWISLTPLTPQSSRLRWIFVVLTSTFIPFFLQAGDKVSRHCGATDKRLCFVSFSQVGNTIINSCCVVGH